jgi:diaminopimelate epimerase
VILEFTKMNGLGNDFILIDDRAGALEFTPDAVAWFCDRHFGIGADGLILVRPATSDAADYYMHYFNADGSLAEMCGNGARCFAKYVVDRELVPAEATSLVIETLGGLRPVTLTRCADGSLAEATVDMGAPVFEPACIPTMLPGDRVVDAPLETPTGTVLLTAVSMGNPHAIIWVDDVDAAPVETVGPFVERHDAFPNGTNVEFAQVVDDRTVRLRVWERGVGETLACGTGASATGVAAAASGRTGRETTIVLPGGDLRIAWADDDHVYMTGSASVSFTGSIDLGEDVAE